MKSVSAPSFLYKNLGDWEKDTTFAWSFFGKNGQNHHKTIGKSGQIMLKRKIDSYLDTFFQNVF